MRFWSRGMCHRSLGKSHWNNLGVRTGKFMDAKVKASEVKSVDDTDFEFLDEAVGGVVEGVAPMDLGGAFLWVKLDGCDLHLAAVVVVWEVGQEKVPVVDA